MVKHKRFCFFFLSRRGFSFVQCNLSLHVTVLVVFTSEACVPARTLSSFAAVCAPVSCRAPCGCPRGLGPFCKIDGQQTGTYLPFTSTSAVVLSPETNQGPSFHPLRLCSLVPTPPSVAAHGNGHPRCECFSLTCRQEIITCHYVASNTISQPLQITVREREG